MAVGGLATGLTLLAAEPTPDYAAACSNAWLRGVTAKAPATYGANEEIAFTLTLAGVTNEIPSGVWRCKWKRTGDDGVTTEGVVPLEKKTAVCKVPGTAAGPVRLSAEIIDASGRPVLRSHGAQKTPIRFTGGVLAAADRIATHAEPPELAPLVKDLLKRLGRPAFKKVARTPVEAAGFKDLAFYRVELPSPTAHPVRGLLALPKATAEGARFKATLRFSGIGHEAEIPIPKPTELRTGEITFFLAFDPGASGARDAAFCTDLYLQTLLALAYLHALPEWSGHVLRAEGWGMNGVPAVWAAGADVGVTELSIAQLPTDISGPFDPFAVAHRIPPSCRVTVARVPLGDARQPAAAAAFVNALKGDYTVVWNQGAEGWTLPPSYTGRDTRTEHIAPLRYRHLDAEHAKIDPFVMPPIRNPSAEMTDSLVIEVNFDPGRLEGFDAPTIARLVSYARESLAPLVVYGSVPNKKIKDKTWATFCAGLKKASVARLPFPVYQQGGLDLPPPDVLPWFRLVGPDGVLRYEGTDAGALQNAMRALLAKLPPADPVFMYAKPDLLKDLVDPLVKAKTPGSRLYKAVDRELKRVAKTDPARAKEAEHLLIGLEQAVERRLKAMNKLLSQRPGSAVLELEELLAEWPELAGRRDIASLKARMAKNPDFEKLAKLEKELLQLQAWQPEKPMEIKKKDAAVAAFAKKLERFTKSTDATVQGEAALIEADFQR